MAYLIVGAGNHIFVFSVVVETRLASTTWEVIADFVRGQDKIDLFTLDANALTASSNEAFSFIGATAFSTTDATGQLRVFMIWRTAPACSTVVPMRAALPSSRSRLPG